MRGDRTSPHDSLASTLEATQRTCHSSTVPQSCRPSACHTKASHSRLMFRPAQLMNRRCEKKKILTAVAVACRRRRAQGGRSRLMFRPAQPMNRRCGKKKTCRCRGGVSACDESAVVEVGVRASATGEPKMCANKNIAAVPVASAARTSRIATGAWLRRRQGGYQGQR